MFQLVKASVKNITEITLVYHFFMLWIFNSLELTWLKLVVHIKVSILQVFYDGQVYGLTAMARVESIYLNKLCGTIFLN